MSSICSPTIRRRESPPGWRQHPSIAVIARDRASIYTEAIAQGAPQAQQVADRWHLTQNLSTALREIWRGTRRCCARSHNTYGTAMPGQRGGAAAGPRVAAHGGTRAHRRPCLPAPAPVRRGQAPAHAGLERSAVSRRHCGSSAVPPPATCMPPTCRAACCHKRPPVWLPIARICASAGSPVCRRDRSCWRNCTRGAIVAAWPASIGRSNPGVPGMGASIGRSQPRPASACPLPVRPPSCSSARREELPAEDAAYRAALCAHSPTLATAAALAQQFPPPRPGAAGGCGLHRLAAATACEIKELVHFAQSLRRDYAAVRAALALPWSNGQTEGQVNRIKMIKRTMFGCAGFRSAAPAGAPCRLTLLSRNLTKSRQTAPRR